MRSELSYVTGESTIPLLGETIGQNLARTVARYPNHDALVCVEQGCRYTYSEFYAETTKVARGLLAVGVNSGDRVGIWSPNRAEWVLIQYATARIGAILVNVNPAYRIGELEFVINQSGISTMIAATQFKSSDYESMLNEVSKKSETLKRVYFLDRDWDALVEKSSEVNDDQLFAVENAVQFDDPVNIQYTSGTTGFPKGVTLSHHNILNNGYFIGIRMNYTSEDRVCIPVPFYHCFGMVIGNLCCTAHGACMVIPSESFTAESALKAVEKEKCTSLYGVPTMFIAELNFPHFEDYNLSSLRTGVMAGSPCPVEIMKQVQTKMNMKEVTICYGMTETSPVSVQTKIGVPMEKQVSTVGTVHDHLEIKIIDPETGHIVQRGVAGELCTRGYSVLLKYWNNPEATRSVLDDARWMHTGDLATMDDEGYITITGRIKDLIIRGGENISPKEIEDFIYKHPSVEDVQVIGVPSEKYGEEVMAWVKLKQGEPISEQELATFCKEHIAYYKVPKYWKFVEDFPMTVSGKIRKIEMREIAAKELGLAAE